MERRHSARGVAARRRARRVPSAGRADGLRDRRGTTPPAADSTIVARLRAARQRGAPWPTRGVVGAAGVCALWLLAAGDSALAPAVLHRMMESGPDESLPADVAVLEDRLRARAGRKQLYGTQLRAAAGGDVTPFPMEDPAHVGMRRDAAGLPLAQSLCLARSLGR